MKKINLFIITLCLLLVGIVGCARQTDNTLVIQNPVTPMRIHHDLDSNVSMFVDENNCSQLVVTIFNNSEYELTTGHHFFIEFFDGYDWWWIFSDNPFTDEGLVIQSNDSITLNKNLYFTVGALPPGQYRVWKSVFRDIDIPITEYYLHDLVAEFYVD